MIVLASPAGGTVDLSSATDARLREVILSRFSNPTEVSAASFELNRRADIRRRKVQEARRRDLRQQARRAERVADAVRRLEKHGTGALPKNFTEALGDAGEAKDQAAAEVGLSRPTAEKAAAVVLEIDAATAAGDTARAELLTVNTSPPRWLTPAPPGRET